MQTKGKNSTKKGPQKRTAILVLFLPGFACEFCKNCQPRKG